MTSEELQRENERLKSARKHTQEWYARHYGKLEDWARTRLPEPWVTEFFNCVANGTHDSHSDDYFRVDTAEGQLILDQTKRAEDAESRVKTLEAALKEWRLDFTSLKQYAGLLKDALMLISRGAESHSGWWSRTTAEQSLVAKEPTA